MAVDWLAVKAALRRWVMITTDLPEGLIVFAKQGAPRPAPGPFVVINPRVSLARRGVRDEQRPDPDSSDHILHIGQRQLTVSVNAIGQAGMNLAGLACDGLDRIDVREALDAAGLSVIDQGDVQDLSALIETQFEERGQFDAVFALVSVDREFVGRIEKVALEGTIDPGSVALDFTVGP